VLQQNAADWRSSKSFCDKIERMFIYTPGEIGGVQIFTCTGQRWLVIFDASGWHP
jgi:hypothetical protein